MKTKPTSPTFSAILLAIRAGAHDAASIVTALRTDKAIWCRRSIGAVARGLSKLDRLTANLLGKLRSRGLVVDESRDGVTRWRLTTDGEAACRNVIVTVVENDRVILLRKWEREPGDKPAYLIERDETGRIVKSSPIG